MSVSPFLQVQKMVSLQLPGFIGFTAPQLWIEIIEHSLLVRLGSTAHIWHYLVILQGLLQLDRSQGSRLNCWLLLTPAQASDPNLFTLQALSLSFIVVVVVLRAAG